jgi:hypothetical protein
MRQYLTNCRKVISPKKLITVGKKLRQYRRKYFCKISKCEALWAVPN